MQAFDKYINTCVYLLIFVKKNLHSLQNLLSIQIGRQKEKYMDIEGLKKPYEFCW